MSSNTAPIVNTTSFSSINFPPGGMNIDKARLPNNIMITTFVIFRPADVTKDGCLSTRSLS